MKKVMCINRHYYDAERNKACPHCGSIERISENAMKNDSIGESMWLGSDGEIHNTVGNTIHINELNDTIYLDSDETILLDNTNNPMTQKKADRLCYNCFEVYKDRDGICPHCGYMISDAGKEPYYLKPGTILTKRFIIGQAVGAGGFGITYKAWDTNLNKVVAIKEYFPSSVVTRTPGEKKVVTFSTQKETQYATGLKKFLEEARMMSMFSKNENVCNTYDFFEENNTAYIVMEFLYGNSLKDYLREGGNWPTEEESVQIILQVLAGLEEIHKKNIVHLDIAPDNIWLLPNNKVKIIDFGAARHMVDKSKKRDIIVKRGFAPFEQYLENGNLGPWTDVYAVGATLYYLLTKRIPMESSDRYANDLMEAPCEISLASESISDAIMRAMALSYELRYRNVGEFVHDIKKEKVKSLQKEIKKRKRKRAVFLTSVVAASILLIVGCFYATLWRDTLLKEEVLVWLAMNSEETKDEKLARYEASIASFQEKYPNISIEVVMKDAQMIETEFFEVAQENRPDLIEIPDINSTIINECVSLEEVFTSEQGYLLNGIFDVSKVSNDKVCPLGMYVSVIYAQKNQQLSELTQISSQEFLTSGEGYCVSYSDEYFLIRDTLAGRYDIIESTTPQQIFTENFAVYSRTPGKENVAQTLLSYLLTDAAQDILHIQNRSTAMPVAKNALDAYLDIYTEFQYLEHTLASYPTLLNKEK